MKKLDIISTNIGVDSLSWLYSLLLPLYVHHMSYHKETRNYQCQLFQERFHLNSNLVVHIRIHTENRPFFSTIYAKKNHIYELIADSQEDSLWREATCL